MTTVILQHSGMEASRVKAMDSSSNSNASSDSAAITANDFLTLLVTEMKNQDPTAAQDPNEYINQLVNVNSLQQLISINQNLAEVLGISPTGSVSTSATGQAATPTTRMADLRAQSSTAVSIADDSKSLGRQSRALSYSTIAPGNLSIPPVNAAAQAVASSLRGRTIPVR